MTTVFECARNKFAILAGCATAAFVLCALPLAAPATASTYKLWNCESTECSYSWTLGKLATKEFRGACRGKAGPLPAISVRNKGNHTTCTIPYAGVGGPYGAYETKSCTNWATGHKDTITINFDCTD